MLRDIRKQYQYSALTEDQADKNPFSQFQKWLSEAIDSSEMEPTAMVLSTVDVDLQPHSRVVLLKDFTDDGIVFFTNYSGNKSNQIATNQQVSILFFWQSLERQVRITGIAEKIEESESDAYFHSRPTESQLGAWSSPQSQVIENYEVLTDNFEKYKQQFKDNITRPAHWGGFLIRPTTFEFWQGRPNRMHDRLFFSRQDEEWKMERLAP